MTAEVEDTGAAPALLTIAQAAAATGLHARTIRRGIRAGAYPSAVMEGGAWHLTAADLIAAGHDLTAPTASPEPPAPEVEEIARLRSERDDWRRRAEVAEALASERDRTVEGLLLALRALPAGPAEPPADRRRWGRRRRQSDNE